MRLLIFLLAIFVLDSCVTYPTMSYSTSQNVPVLQNRNEVRLSAVTLSEGYGFQGAYAFSRSFAVMGSYERGIFEQTGFESNAGNRRSSELAFGYYKSNENSTCEIFGGVERYHRDFTVWEDEEAGSLPSDSFRTNATKYFVQFDVAKSHSGKHCFAGTMKIGYLVYDHFSFTHFGAYGAPDLHETNAKSGIVAKPCITYRLGMNAFSFQTQAGLNLQNIVSMYDSGGDFFINVGLSLRLFQDKGK